MIRRTLWSGVRVLAVGGVLAMGGSLAAVEAQAQPAADKPAADEPRGGDRDRGDRDRGDRDRGDRDRGDRDRGERERGERERGERERGDRPEGRGERPGPPPNPWMQMFDTDRDGEISAAEISAASEVLKKLDRNDDGAITRDELPRPPRGGFGPPRDGFGPPRDGERRGYGPRGEGGPRGRLPMERIAEELDVTPEALRDAFRQVGPAARGERPTPEQREKHRKELAEALDVSPERLGEVFDKFSPGRPRPAEN